MTSRSASAGRSFVMQSWRAQFVLLSAIWGSSFLCIKVLDEVWAPVDVALARVALGALFLVGLLVVRRTPLPRDPVAWRHVAVVGLLMNALPFTLFAYGEQHVSSVIAGLWNGTTPLMTLVAVLLLLPDERPDRRRLAGLAGGFAGLVVLLGPWQGLGGGKLLGDLACALGACCYGLGLTYTRRHLSARPEGGVELAGAQLLCRPARRHALVRARRRPARQRAGPRRPGQRPGVRPHAHDHPRGRADDVLAGDLRHPDLLDVPRRDDPVRERQLEPAGRRCDRAGLDVGRVTSATSC